MQMIDQAKKPGDEILNFCQLPPLSPRSLKRPTSDTRPISDILFASGHPGDRK